MLRTHTFSLPILLALFFMACFVGLGPPPIEDMQGDYTGSPNLLGELDGKTNEPWAARLQFHVSALKLSIARGAALVTF